MPSVTTFQPATIRALPVTVGQIAELGVVADFDNDLAAQITTTSNLLRGMLTPIHPALERALGRHHVRAGHRRLYSSDATLLAAGTGVSAGLWLWRFWL